jgi:hypothetical protein
MSTAKVIVSKPRPPAPPVVSSDVGDDMGAQGAQKAAAEPVMEGSLLPVAGSPRGEVTVRLSLDLLQQARLRAEDEGLTFDRWVEQALQKTLERGAHGFLPTVAGDGLIPGVDLSDIASLLHHMERPDAAA